MSVLTFSSEKERSRVRAVQIDNLGGLLGIRRTDRVSNALIRGLCGVGKCLDEGLIKAPYGGLTMWRGWRGIGSSREPM